MHAFTCILYALTFTDHIHRFRFCHECVQLSDFQLLSHLERSSQFAEDELWSTKGCCCWLLGAGSLDHHELRSSVGLVLTQHCVCVSAWNSGVSRQRRVNDDGSCAFRKTDVSKHQLEQLDHTPSAWKGGRLKEWGGGLMPVERPPMSHGYVANETNAQRCSFNPEAIRINVQESAPVAC